MIVPIPQKSAYGLEAMPNVVSALTACLLVVPALLCVRPRNVTAAPVIGPGHDAEILALLDPYGMNRDIVRGWQCTGITASNEIDLTLQRGDGTITVELHDPAWTGEAQSSSPHFRIAVRATDSVDAADREQVATAVAALVAGNDRTNLWY